MSYSKLEMPCNKPRKSTSKGKKKMVKACKDGKEKIVHYGAKGYKHNYSDQARKNFHSRHNCKDKEKPSNKLTAGYWACKDLW